MAESDVSTIYHRVKLQLEGFVANYLSPLKCFREEQF